MTKRTELKCNRCGYVWLPRKREDPTTCPKCRSPYWNRPRVRPSKDSEMNRTTDGGNGNAEE